MSISPLGPRLPTDTGTASGAASGDPPPAAPAPEGAAPVQAAANPTDGEAQRWAESLLDGVAWMDALRQAASQRPPPPGDGEPAAMTGPLTVPLPLRTPPSPLEGLPPMAVVPRHDRPPDDTPPAADALPSPMALFGRLEAPPPAATPAPAPAVPAAVDLASHLQALAVSTDADGQRRVRLTLADPALPGTEVMLRHEGGALQVEFFCRDGDSCLRLQQQAPALAERLAQGLQQPVALSVERLADAGASHEPGGDGAARLTVQAWPQPGSGA